MVCVPKQSHVINDLTTFASPNSGARFRPCSPVSLRQRTHDSKRFTNRFRLRAGAAVRPEQRQ
ncbi:MAG: hypothetical protein AAF311_18030, partial [Pseudomonadota bacterium]